MRALKFYVFLVLTFFSTTAIAANPQLDSIYQDWNVFSLTEGKEKICYIASSPKKSSGNYRRRGQPYFLVTHRGKNVDEISTSSGYPYKKKSKVVLKINKFGTFKLFTKGEIAWASDTQDDRRIVRGMKKGRVLTIRGTSQKSTYSLDTYSLMGFSKAYSRMKKLCS